MQPQIEDFAKNQFLGEHKEMVERIQNPEFLQRIERINRAMETEEEDIIPRPPTEVTPANPVRYFERLPGETESEMIQRWRQLFMKINAPIDQRANLNHQHPAECNGYPTANQTTITTRSNEEFDVTPEMIGLPTNTTMSQDMLISRFMPIIPEALRIIPDDNATVALTLEAAPIERLMETD